MGKQPVRMKAVVYALSRFQQKVMPGLFKDLPGKISHKFLSSWMGAILLLGPLVGTYYGTRKRRRWGIDIQAGVLDSSAKSSTFPSQ